MSFLLKDTIHQSLVDSVYNEFLSRRANYYYYIGKVIDWADTNAPDAPDITASYENTTRNDIITVKKINVRDISYVVRRINWETNTLYDEFNGDYSSSNPSSTGATNIKDAIFYVLTSSFGVYKCIHNNMGAASTIEPSGVDVTPVTYSDGYIWKYMYTIPLSARNRFLTEDFMPVQRAIDNKFYSNGEISSIVIDNAGSGYSSNSNVTLTVNGTFLGKPGNSIANLSPVFTDSGEFVDVVINNPGNNYSNATIVITDLLNAGGSYYKGVANVRIYNIGQGYTPVVRNNTTVTITTTGASQPTANAVLQAVYSDNNNTFVGVTVVTSGSGYTTAAKNNTSIVISTTGASQPTSNATANVFYTPGAVLTPVLHNGKIDRVLINDPGTGYSANNQTVISTIGDGTGVVLLPVINSAGELSDVIIEERGSGYTYLDIQVVGSGSNANAYATFFEGDLNTIQSSVELSAIKGGIHAFEVIQAGDSYTTANITVYGDGSGFVGDATVVDGSINEILVTNPGVGYTFANVIIDGDGANSIVSAIISPDGGHGKDAVKELFSDTIILYTTINNEKNQGVTVNNDYRQFGIIKNLKKYGSEQIFTAATGSGCFLYTLNTVVGLNRDDDLAFTDDNNQRRNFIVIEVLPNTNQVLMTNKSNYNLVAGDVLQNSTLLNFYVQSIDETPDINKFSGDLLYIDNRTTVSYSDQQLVTLRTIIQL